jgi:hypothetical protein
MGVRGVLESERRYAEEAGRLRTELENAKAKLVKLEPQAESAYHRGMIAGILWTCAGIVLWHITQSFWIEIWWHARAFWP